MRVRVHSLLASALVLLLPAGSPSVLAAQELPQGETQIGRHEVAIGEPVGLSILPPEGDLPGTNPVATDVPEGVEVRRVELREGRLHAELAVFDLDLSELPPVAFSYRGASGEVKTFQSAPVPIRVRPTTAEDETRLKDIAGPQTVPLSWGQYALYGLLILGAVAIAGRLLRRYLTRERVGGLVPEKPLPPAAEEALAALSSLESEDLPGQERVTEQCTRLSYILRRYLERRYAFPALEETTDEVRRQLRRTFDEDPDNLAGEAEKLLLEWDLVKFARVEMAVQRAREGLIETRAWVERTRPVLHPALSDPDEEDEAQPAAEGAA